MQGRDCAAGNTTSDDWISLPMKRQPQLIYGGRRCSVTHYGPCCDKHRILSVLLQVDRLASLWSASQAAVKSVNEDLAAKCQAVAGLQGEVGKAREDLAAREGEVDKHRGAMAALEVFAFIPFSAELPESQPTTFRFVFTSKQTHERPR